MMYTQNSKENPEKEQMEDDPQAQKDLDESCQSLQDRFTDCREFIQPNRVFHGAGSAGKSYLLDCLRKQEFPCGLKKKSAEGKEQEDETTTLDTRGRE